MSKCEAIWMGCWRKRKTKPLHIKWPDGCIKICGIYISYDKTTAAKLNLVGPTEKLRKSFNFWKMRDLTLHGKVQVIKTLGISRLLYVINLTNPHTALLKQLEQQLFSFLWKGPEKIPRKTMIGSVAEGGLGMPDIFSIYKAQRINWLRRLLDDEVVHPWKRLFQIKLKPVGNINLLLKCNFKVSSLPVQLSTFEISLLSNWLEIQNHSKNSTHYLNQYIWNNSRILVGGKGIFLKEFADSGFNFIGQMFDGRGHLLNWETVSATGVPQQAFLKWYGIIHSIPVEWKSNIDMNNFTALQQNNDVINVTFPNASYDLLQCKTKS